jgi:hypothetical protein
MNQEHPTGTERSSLYGRVATEAAWLNVKNARNKKLWKEQKQLLTWIGLLMEGAIPVLLTILTRNPPQQPASIR